MPKRDYIEWEVVEQLKKKGDIRIKGKQIAEMIQGKGDVGIKSKGKIDFLVNYLGYNHFFVPDFKQFQ